MHRFDQRLQLLPPTLLALIAEIDENKGRWAGGAQLIPKPWPASDNQCW